LGVATTAFPPRQGLPLRLSKGRHDRCPQITGRGPLARIVLPVALLATLLLVTRPVLATPLPDETVSVEVSVEGGPGPVRLGDHVKLRVAVAHHEGARLQFPQASAFEPTGLEVLRVQPSQDLVAQGGGAAMEYVLAGFRPRTYTIPPSVLQVFYRMADGRSGHAAPPGPVTIVVESVLIGMPNPSLQDIRPPVGLPHPLASLVRPAAAGALAGALLLLMLLRHLWRRRPSRPVPAISPAQRARAALDAAARLLAGPEPDYSAFYAEIAATLRLYLAQRAGLPALSSTTRELRRRLELSANGRWPSQLIVGLLEQTDSVRWAHRLPDPAGPQRALVMAHQVVDLVEASTAGHRPAAPAVSRSPATLAAR